MQRIVHWLLRIVRWMLVALVAFATAVACVLLANRLPLAAPPGPGTRAAVYVTAAGVETRADSPFPELRTRNFSVPASVLYAKVAATVATMPGWSVVEKNDDRREIHALVTRTYSGSEDDVTVTVVPEPGGRPALKVRGLARSGRPDLGANARHVLDLYDALAAAGVKGVVEE